MIVLRPKEVVFGGETWADVDRIAVDRTGTRVIREWGGEGSALVFADVGEYQVRARVWQALDRTMLDGPLPGELGLVRIELDSGTDVGRRQVRFDGVVESVTHEISEFRAVRVISLIAVSDEGDEDPVSVFDAS